MQLGRYGIRCDVFVVWWELVPRQAERANPHSGTNVNLTETVLAEVSIMRKLICSQESEKDIWQKLTRRD